jgi:hypothetical protein
LLGRQAILDLASDPVRGRNSGLFNGTRPIRDIRFVKTGEPVRALRNLNADNLPEEARHLSADETRDAIITFETADGARIRVTVGAYPGWTVDQIARLAVTLARNGCNGKGRPACLKVVGGVWRDEIWRSID